MPVLIPIIPYIRRPRRAPAVVDAGPLVLVAASYDQDGPTATLTFDRAVDLGAFEGTQLRINDPLFWFAQFDASGGATLVSPTVVQVTLLAVDLPSGDVVTMTATGMTGIVAVGDGASWAGVTGLDLPFP